MIRELQIKNIATMSDVSISLADDMTVVTGDTGAGKSLLLSALNLIIGARTNTSLIRHGTTAAEVVASFDITSIKKAQQYLQDNDLLADDSCIIRRIISSNGKSKAMINNILVPLSSLRQLSSYLIEIYGQNQQQNILKPQAQMALLDDYAKNSKLLRELGNIVLTINNNNQQILAIKKSQDNSKEQLEMCNYKLLELENAQFDIEEITTIDERYRVYANSKSLLETATITQETIENDIYDKLSVIIKNITVSATIDTKLESVIELISGSQIQIQEANYELSKYLEKLLAGDNQDLNIEERLVELNLLARKHNCQISELESTKQDIIKKIANLNPDNGSIEELEQKNVVLLKKYQHLSSTISANRKKSAQLLSVKVSNVMHSLGLPKSQLLITIDTLDGVNSNGNDVVLFKIMINTGSDYQNLAQSISGGELSRVNLAIAVATNSVNMLPTLVFDEVDAGISGAVAEVVGRALNKLARKSQILCITHLAQVAAQGKQHLLVAKKQLNNHTNSTISKLNNNQKIAELARILAGVDVSIDAINVAKKLLNTV